MRNAVAGLGAALALSFAASAPVVAQSSFGDTNVTYSHGVVYDDDLVPGRGLNQNFQGGDSTAVVSGGSSSGGFVPAPSPNLIGSDGRAIDAIRQSQLRAEQFNRTFLDGR